MGWGVHDYPVFREDRYAHAPPCPVCGSDHEKRYTRGGVTVLGCPDCITWQFADANAEAVAEGTRLDPKCPECGRSCYRVHFRDGVLIGCDQCIDWQYAASLR